MQPQLWIRTKHSSTEGYKVTERVRHIPQEEKKNYSCCRWHPSVASVRVCTAKVGTIHFAIPNTLFVGIHPTIHVFEDSVRPPNSGTVKFYNASRVAAIVFWNSAPLCAVSRLRVITCESLTTGEQRLGGRVICCIGRLHFFQTKGKGCLSSWSPSVWCQPSGQTTVNRSEVSW